MERLTDKKEADAQRIEYQRRLAQGYPRNIPEERFLKLAAYEDTGLEPKEIPTGLEMANMYAALQQLKRYEAIGAIEQLAKRKGAEEQGLWVWLPCKVGDRVKVDAKTWGNTWNYKTIEYGKFLLGEVVSIIRTKKQTLMKIRVEHNVSWKRPMKRYPVSAMGVTIFPLVKEAAEQELKDKARNEVTT